MSAMYERECRHKRANVARTEPGYPPSRRGWGTGVIHGPSKKLEGPAINCARLLKKSQVT